MPNNTTSSIDQFTFSCIVIPTGIRASFVYVMEDRRKTAKRSWKAVYEDTGQNGIPHPLRTTADIYRWQDDGPNKVLGYIFLVIWSPTSLNTTIVNGLEDSLRERRRRGLLNKITAGVEQETTFGHGTPAKFALLILENIRPGATKRIRKVSMT